MALPVLDVTDLADFKGKEEMMFGFFAPTAINLAAVLVREIGQVHDIDPADVRGTQLYTYAVLDLAYEIYIEQEYADININPFASETIGSYSYSKSQSAKKLISGDTTDQLWLELLRTYLEGLNYVASDVQYGGIDFDDTTLVYGPNNPRVISPLKDIRYFDNILGNEYGPGVGGSTRF